MSRSILLVPVALMSFALAGCANDPYSGPKQDAGTVFGALTGARALNELAIDAFAESGPAVLHVAE